MKVGRSGRGTALLLAHCASFDPATETARERLEDALGAELARKLVSGLAAGPPERPAALGSRTIFAA